jgi:glucan phosphorylase
VVQLTTLDGWVKEVGNEQIGEVFGYQHKDGETMGSESALRLKEDSQSLYDALENLANLYYQTYNNGDINVQSQWIDLMINCICQSAFFNSHRMVGEYRQNMWRV